MTKIIRILRSCSMKIFCKFPTINISKLNFWLVICIAKNFIWTTLKMIFSIFRFFCTLRFQIYKYCPIITNHTSMERLFIQLQMMYTFQKIDPYDWFCAPGSHTHTYIYIFFSQIFDLLWHYWMRIKLGINWINIDLNNGSVIFYRADLQLK